MRIHNSQPRALQTCSRQVREEVSPDAPPTTPLFLIPAQSPMNPCSSVAPLSAIPRHRQRTIAFPPASSRFNTHSASGIEAV